jgi:hypothetical protein
METLLPRLQVIQILQADSSMNLKRVVKNFMI